MLTNCSKKEKSNTIEHKKNNHFSFFVYNSASAIPTKDWASIAKLNKVFLELDYLTCLEKNSPPSIHFHYVIFYDQDIPIAIAYFQVMDISLENFGGKGKSKIIKKNFFSEYIKNQFKNYIKKTAGKLNFRILMCGNAFISGENGLAHLQETDTTKLYHALNQAIDKIVKAEKISGKIAAIMIKDFYKYADNESSKLRDYKFKDFLVEPNMVLNVSWNSFDDYLDSMNKKYRNRGKNIIKKGLDLERKNLSFQEISNQNEEIFKLYQQVRSKAKFKMGAISSSYFSEMKNILQEKFQLTAYYRSGELLAFKTAFKLENKLEAHFIGINYEVNQELELYQNILYDYVKDAISFNVEELVLGRTASEIKSTIGAKARELTCYIRHRNSISNRVLSPFLECIKPSEWIPRKPFKQNDVF